jgi:lipopolysaccharide transport system permease protein
MIKFFRDLIKYRELLLALLYKEIAVRYKQSVLGPVWAVLQPLALMLIFTAVRSFISIPSDGIPYPIFVYAALVPWTFFANTVTRSSPSIVANAAVIKKIYFPREVFPVAAALATGFDFLISAFIYLGLAAYYGIYPGSTLLFIPVLLFIQFIFAIGLGLITSILCGFRRDVVIGVPLILNFWMFLTPVIYPLSSVPERYLSIYLLNPMVGLIEGYRQVLLHNSLPELWMLSYSIIGALIALVIGLEIFSRLERRLADIL